jgi:hypothetical protein
LTYIDGNTKCVFNGSDVGKEYSAKGILEKCGILHIFSQFVEGIQDKIPESKKLNPELDNNELSRIDLPKFVDEIITPCEVTSFRRTLPDLNHHRLRSRVMPGPSKTRENFEGYYPDQAARKRILETKWFIIGSHGAGSRDQLTERTSLEKRFAQCVVTN